MRLFWDSRTSDAKPADNEKLFSITLSNRDAEGTIDLYAVRDYKPPDENGYGKLTGLRIAVQEEYEKISEAFPGKKTESKPQNNGRKNHKNSRTEQATAKTFFFCCHCSVRYTHSCVPRQSFIDTNVPSDAST